MPPLALKEPITALPVLKWIVVPPMLAAIVNAGSSFVMLRMAVAVPSVALPVTEARVMVTVSSDSRAPSLRSRQVKVLLAPSPSAQLSVPLAAV